MGKYRFSLNTFGQKGLAGAQMHPVSLPCEKVKTGAPVCVNPLTRVFPCASLQSQTLTKMAARLAATQETTDARFRARRP